MVHDRTDTHKVSTSAVPTGFPGIPASIAGAFYLQIARLISFRAAFFILVCSIFLPSLKSWALEPDEILLVVNGNVPEGTDIAKKYCARRGIPESQVVVLGMPKQERISRQEYERFLARPLTRHFEKEPELQKRIRCLLTVFGVPIQIGRYVPTAGDTHRIVYLTKRLEDRREVLKTQFATIKKYAIHSNVELPATLNNFDRESSAVDSLSAELPALRVLLEKLADLNETSNPGVAGVEDLDAFQRLMKEMLGAKEKDFLNSGGSGTAGRTDDAVARQYREPPGEDAGIIPVCEWLLAEIVRIERKESEASVDSELSLLPWGRYDLQGWLPNTLNPAVKAKMKPPYPPRTLMVSRLDGPTAEIAGDLVDRALEAERDGPKGRFYIDASAAMRKKGGTYKHFDESLSRLAEALRAGGQLEVVLEESGALFQPGSCPGAMLYCGWYSVNKYIDAFEWAPGSVGYHISSFAAKGLHTQASEGWCKRMLEEGITATLGPVSEPYLLAFPLPEAFFGLLLTGEKSLVECYYLTKPFNSWRMMLIGDPLYNPFSGN